MDKKEKIVKAIPYAILVFAFIFYMSLCGGPQVWADESYTFSLIKHSYLDLCRITAADVHPPLYYLIVKTLTAPFGYSLFSTKIVSVIPCMLLLVESMVLLPKVFDKKTAYVFMIVFCTFPFVVPYAYEIRNYSWAELFLFTAIVESVQVLRYNRKKDWIICTVATICGAYSHYFAFVSVAFIAFFMLVAILVKKRELIRNWLIYAAACFVCYLPWLGFFYSSFKETVGNVYWIEDISRYTLGLYLREIFGVFYFPHYYLVVIAVCIFLFINVAIKKNAIDTIFCIYAASIPILTAFVGVFISVAFRPIFVIRYIVPAMPCLILFIAFGIGKLKNKYVMAVIAAILTFGAIANYHNCFRVEYIKQENVLNRELLDELPEVDTYLVDTYSQVGSVLSYYEHDKEIFCDLDTPIEANAFDNKYPASYIDLDKYDRICFMINTGDPVPEELLERYDATFEKTINATGMFTDVYTLVAK